jgi:hypothetical protein
MVKFSDLLRNPDPGIRDKILLCVSSVVLTYTIDGHAKELSLLFTENLLQGLIDTLDDSNRY